MTTVDITGQLATYMAQARDMRLAPHVAQDAKHRILDALAAMVSGSHLPAGEMAIHFARAQGGVAEATVVATDIRTSAVNAALANGMFGSPRRYAIRERSNRSVSIRSVFTRRARRSTCRLAGSINVIAYAVCFELPVEPETVIAGLV